MNFDLTNIVRKNILELKPYRCARDDYSEGILLDANENSFGSSTVSHSHLQLNRYPDPLNYDLKNKIGSIKSVRKEQIFLGVGSDEAIDILIRIFCVPNEDNILITPPTYGMYKVCAKINDVEVVCAPLTPEFDVNIEATIAAVTIKTKLLFLCSPGNPTSKSIPNQVIERILSTFRTGIVIVDEAYVDFSSQSSACALIDNYPNVVVLQTFSKAFGLAGIRLGMAIGNEAIIQLMNNVKAPYNVNKLTLDIINNALDDLTLYQQHINDILNERKYLIDGLSALPFIQKIHHSDANFVLFVLPKAEEVYKIMADRGLVARFRGNELHCGNCLRVTVGTHDENQKYLALLKEVASELGIFDPVT